jgi:hypothetical protein
VTFVRGKPRRNEAIENQKPYVAKVKHEDGDAAAKKIVVANHAKRFRSSGEKQIARRTRGKGEGTISRRKDGRWWARIELDRKNGRRVRKGFYGHTRLAVASLLNETQHHRSQGSPVPIGRRTVGEFI